MRDDRTTSWLRNMEFLAVMDWTETETTRAADIVLPGTTYLESEGTRCNFEGRVLAFERAVPPPSGMPGWQVLLDLARACGVNVVGCSAADLTREIATLVRDSLDGALPFLWNTGEERAWPKPARLVPVAVDGGPASAEPAITHGERYKRSIQEVGTERYRVIG
jgi:anaerobic selenocysteine-containing dehydrogenase